MFLKPFQAVTVLQFVRERSVEVLYDGDGEDNSIATILLDALLECPLDCRTQLANSILITGYHFSLHIFFE